MTEQNNNVHSTETANQPSSLEAQWLKDVFANLASEAISHDRLVGTIDWESFASQIHARYAAPPLKDHVIRETVNVVAETAREYQDAGQLRARLADILVSVLRGTPPQLHTVIGKGGRYYLIDTAMPAGTAKSLNVGPLTFYTDAVTGASYYRIPEDFRERVVPISVQSHKG